jgi:hypothetical protein
VTAIDILKKSYASVVRLLPERAAGRIDLLRPSYWTSGFGPMNGQAFRQQMVRQIMRRITFDEVLETGSYRGTTTVFLAHVGGVPVRSVEFVRRYHEFATVRTAQYEQVSVERGDSRAFLRSWMGEPGVDERTVFAYLDAHWEKELPLTEELEAILSSGAQAVILIDDFQVPDDPGYGYDDYGPGMALTLDLIPEVMRSEWTMFYPRASSAEETGAKRGSIVIASPSLATQLAGADALRGAPSTSS